MISYPSGADTVGFLHSELPFCRTSLLRLARRLTRNRDEAEDLVQDTLFRAYRRAETFRGLLTRDAVSRWLSAILRNHFYNLCERSKRTATMNSVAFDEETGHTLCRYGSGINDSPAVFCEAQQSL